MTDISTTHHTIVVKRSYPTLARHVFAAWGDPAALARWYTPGDSTWSCAILDHQFRVGGRKHIAFGPPGGPQFFEDCRYEDIVDEQRICFSMTIARETQRITTSMVTVELSARRDATDLVVTDQLVVLDGGDTWADRERGWGETLDKLTDVVRERAY
jgi:uncharacterized protein YndB with AHSA1/START domain